MAEQDIINLQDKAAVAQIKSLLDNTVIFRPNTVATRGGSYETITTHTFYVKGRCEKTFTVTFNVNELTEKKDGVEKNVPFEWSLEDQTLTFSKFVGNAEDVFKTLRMLTGTTLH